MYDLPTRREFSALAVAWLAAGRGVFAAQDEAARDEAKPAAAGAGKLPGPDPVEEVRLLPTLTTVPIRRGSAEYNMQGIDATLLPRDKQGIWVLNFACRPFRLATVEIPGKGRRVIHYLYYRVVNRTGKPRDFVPQFVLVTDTNKRYEESVIPKAVPLIQARENPDIPLRGAVEVSGVIPPSTKTHIDDAVFGVAMWEGVDPHADHLSIYVRGLSDGYKQVQVPDSDKTVTRYKTLRIDFVRRGDARNLNEKEITRAEPPYEWIYW